MHFRARERNSKIYSEDCFGLSDAYISILLHGCDTIEDTAMRSSRMRYHVQPNTRRIGDRPHTCRMSTTNLLNPKNDTRKIPKNQSEWISIWFLNNINVSEVEEQCCTSPNAHR